MSGRIIIANRFQRATGDAFLISKQSDVSLTTSSTNRITPTSPPSRPTYMIYRSY